MSNGPHPVSTAFWTYIIPMIATRAMKIGLVLFVLFLGSVVLIFMGGFVASGFVYDALTGMRHFLIMMEVPVGAVLLSEIPIRDGITHRTLLYPLLGPVPRTTLAVVRVVTTGAVLAFGTCALLVLIRVMLKENFGFLPRELLAVTLGAFVYVTLFGFVHLFNRRGLIAGLVIFFLFDLPLGKVPFSLRNISPSYHMSVVADQQEIFELPVVFGLPGTSVTVSSLILLGITFVFGSAIAYGFKRKDLGSLC